MLKDNSLCMLFINIKLNRYYERYRKFENSNNMLFMVVVPD